MIKEPPDRETLRREYDAAHGKYKKLEDSLKRDLQGFLDEAGIHVLEVQSRVKKFESLWDKAVAKGYSNPLEQTEDICGLRVIAHYSSDLDSILDVISTEFNVLKETDKSNDLGPSEFGYRSIHLIIMVREDWLNAPCYRGLGGLKAEVQVRTVLMHAWASVSHDLWYKVTGVPEEFLAELARLDAVLRGADEKFDELREAKAQYVSGMSEEAEKSGQFDVSLRLNADTLQAFLQFHFDEVPPATDFALIETLSDLKRGGVTLERLENALNKVESYPAWADAKADFLSKKIMMEPTRGSMAFLVLDLGDDEWWEPRNTNEGWQPYVRFVNQWRARLKN